MNNNMKLSDHVVRSFHVAKNYVEPTDNKINAIDFSPDGKLFVSCGTDDFVSVCSGMHFFCNFLT